LSDFSGGKMITECPSCKKTISVVKTGVSVCPKCGAVVHIGDHLKDEENRVVKTPAQLKSEAGKKSPEKENSTEEKRGFFEKLQDISYAEEPGEKKQKKKYSGLFKGTPWDSWRTIGFGEAFYRTTIEIFRRPSGFFKDMKYAVRPGLIPIYGLIAAFLTTLFQTYWILRIFQSLYPDFQTFSKSMENLAAAGFAVFGSEERLKLVFNAMYPDAPTLLFQLLISPFMSIVITAFILHLGSILLGAKTRLNHFYRMSGFIMITGLFSAVPVFGNLAGFIWRSVFVFKGTKVLNNFTNAKAYGVTVFYVVMQIIFSSMGIL
jgi:uncharacterized Zn finger protein (UPF0148 family)